MDASNKEEMAKEIFEEKLPKPLPCPFCSGIRIIIIEDKIKDKKHLLYKAKFTFCWCKLCGARGPWAYSVDDDKNVVYSKCIERWNERRE